jgi:manganese/zinc/iron transport system permease protein
MDSHFYSNKSGLNHFLFGQAASIQRNDLYFILFVSVLLLTLLKIFNRALKLQAFDSTQFELIGWSKKTTNLCFDSALTLTVIIGIQAVGVVLMSALVITPAIFGRLLSNRFENIVRIAIVINVLSVCLGTYISLKLENPSGPWIILILSIVTFLTMIISKKTTKASS